MFARSDFARACESRGSYKRCKRRAIYERRGEEGARDVRVDIGGEIAAALPAVDIGESFSEGEASGVFESSCRSREDDDDEDDE